MHAMVTSWFDICIATMMLGKRVYHVFGNSGTDAASVMSEERAMLVCSGCAIRD